MEYISIATIWIMNPKICIFSPFSFTICYHYMVMLSLNVNTIATLASEYAKSKKKKKYSVKIENPEHQWKFIPATIIQNNKNLEK